MMAAAHHALENAESGRPGGFFEYMNAILMSSMSIEAIANSFGAHVFDEWSYFDNMRPIGKVLLIAEKLGIQVDLDQEPWAAIFWLVSIRNDFAHGKPKLIKIKNEVSQNKLEKARYELPKSKLEGQVTLQGAKRALDTAEAILISFANALPEEDRYDFLSDSWSGGSSPVEENH